MADKKPELILLSGQKITGETIAIMFKRLTGKDASPEEIAQTQKKLDEARAKLPDKA